MALKSPSDLKSKQYYEALLTSPEVRAALDAIAYAEGTANTGRSYQTQYGYETFNSYADHPREVVTKGGHSSSAAGRYQIMRDSWDELATHLGLSDFSPKSQDIWAVARIDQRDALDPLLAGNFEAFAEGVKKEWASFPGANYKGQGMRALEDIKQVFEAAYQEHVQNPANTPATMNGNRGFISPATIDGVTQFSSADAVATPTARPDPYASRMAQQYGQYRQATMPDVLSAAGGLLDTGAMAGGLDYSRQAADMTGGFPDYEGEKNLSRSMAGITPSVTSAPGGLLGAYQQAQYQPASGSGWQGMPTVNERMASPGAMTVEQQRLADAVRNSVAPQVASAPGGLFQSTGAFNNVNQSRPTGSFTPASPFGNGLPAASPASPAVTSRGVEQFYDPHQVQRMAEIDKWEAARSAAYPETPRSYPSTPAPAPARAPVTAVPGNIASAYGAYGASRAAAPSTPVPASRATGIDVANSAMSLADQYASYGAGMAQPQQTASTATQAVPATVAPRQAAPVYSPSTKAAPAAVTPPAAPAAPAMTPERARALGMVETVPGMFMPDVKANPAQVMRDQLGLIARNPLESLARMFAGTLQGGVFHAGNTLGNIASIPGGIFGSAPSYGAYAPGGAGRSADPYSGRTPGDRAISSAFQPGGIFGGTSSRNRDGSWAGNTGSQATPI